MMIPLRQLFTFENLQWGVRCMRRAKLYLSSKMADILKTCRDMWRSFAITRSLLIVLLSGTVIVLLCSEIRSWGNTKSNLIPLEPEATGFDTSRSSVRDSSSLVVIFIADRQFRSSRTSRDICGFLHMIPCCSRFMRFILATSGMVVSHFKTASNRDLTRSRYCSHFRWWESRRGEQCSTIFDNEVLKKVRIELYLRFDHIPFARFPFSAFCPSAKLRDGFVIDVTLRIIYDSFLHHPFKNLPL